MWVVSDKKSNNKIFYYFSKYLGKKTKNEEKTQTQYSVLGKLIFF
jgi:hypothetical protein